MAKAAFSKKKPVFTGKLDSILRKKLVKCYIRNTEFCGVVNCTLRKVGRKFLEALKCGAGEVWIRSVRPIERETKKYYDYLRRREILYTQ